MKSRLYIIVGIIAVMTFIVGMSIASSSINNFDDFVYQLKKPFDGPEREEIDELTYMSSDNLLQRVLDHCEGQRKLASGEIPPRNADGSYNLVDSIGLSFQNNTHYIDNNTCEWQLVEKEPEKEIRIEIGNPNECWYQEDDGTMKPCVRDESMMLPLCKNLKSDYPGKCIVPLSGPDALCINGSLHYPPDENGVVKINDDGCW